MTERNPLIPERIGPYYVYLLIDPRTGEPFYVGKGTGERFRSHGDAARRPVGDALLLADVGTSRVERVNRLARIREIRDAGLEYEVAFARTRIPTEQETYRVEGALIDSLDTYGAPGHGKWVYRLYAHDTIAHATTVASIPPATLS
jgi:hypothetical protein